MAYRFYKGDLVKVLGHKVEGLEIAKDEELISLNKISDLEILKKKDL